MWLRWLPWRYVVSKLAQSRGFIDPVAVVSRLHRFAQPSEVTEPIELLRAGMVFHARGLVNTRAIQHNLDWVWPYWVERQFDPQDDAFVPRAFSITHVNLTHRNWTAVGLPDLEELPIVDPAGLLTPFYDGWSLDAWLILDDGRRLLPSKHAAPAQSFQGDDSARVETVIEDDGLRLRLVAEVETSPEGPVCALRAEADAPASGFLVVSVRPANPEGVQFIHTLAAYDEGRRWRIDDKDEVRFDRTPDDLHLSVYREGDVLISLDERSGRTAVECDVGLATGAAMFRLSEERATAVRAEVPLLRTPRARKRASSGGEVAARWRGSLEGVCQAQIPDERLQGLYDAALRTLVLHSPGDVYPGPYTYKRFWFRDAAFILDAMLTLGWTDRAWRCIERFPERQQRNGYYRSQEGEWDSNGEAIWTVKRWRDLTGESVPEWMLDSVRRGALWIQHKRCRSDIEAPHAGLMPAGFSAEHLGPNDYYYWDVFWSIAGLESAADLLRGQTALAEALRQEAKDMRGAVDRSIDRSAFRRDRPGVPASPYRRMDAGAIGSIAAGYPLRLWDAEDTRLADTVEFLLDHCMVRGGFFQDMIHSGVNAYLTLHLAQTLLRRGDARAHQLIQNVADLASPTGQWPEAIHPRTGGGCMGDGQHVWAAAEWTLMLRNCFVREEGDGLVLCSGVPEAWFSGARPARFGPTATPFGPVAVEAAMDQGEPVVRWEADWRPRPQRLEVVLPGGEVAEADPDAGVYRWSGEPSRAAGGGAA